MGIPEMRKRGYPDTVAAGSIAAGGTLGILIPPSVTMIVYGIATETSIGRLFLAGVFPGLLLVGLFMAWSLYSTWRGAANARRAGAGSYSWGRNSKCCPACCRSSRSSSGVLYAHVWRRRDAVGNRGGRRAAVPACGDGDLPAVEPASDLWVVLRDSTRESVMILFIIGAAGVFSYMLSSLFITQSIAAWITGSRSTAGC
jgi:C4-dicarboxylate transporter DctM subunit